MKSILRSEDGPCLGWWAECTLLPPLLTPILYKPKNTENEINEFSSTVKNKEGRHYEDSKKDRKQRIRLKKETIDQDAPKGGQLQNMGEALVSLCLKVAEECPANNLSAPPCTLLPAPRPSKINKKILLQVSKKRKTEWRDSCISGNCQHPGEGWALDTEFYLSLSWATH